MQANTAVTTIWLVTVYDPGIKPMRLQNKNEQKQRGDQWEKFHAVFSHRIQNDAADKIDHHLSEALQLPRHQPPGGPCHDHEDGDEPHHHPHHDDGFVDGNIEAAEIDLNVIVEFKRMQGTFFHGTFRDASIDYFGHRCAMR